MARLKLPFLLWTAVLVWPSPAMAQEAGRRELASAGVCARCHVTSTLEWGISKHARVAEVKGKRVANCVGCHGQSRDHVVDEQNTALPDVVARGNAIARLCLECHQLGPSHPSDTRDCQSCHHIHALVNPTLDAEAIQKRAEALDAKVLAYKARAAEGERLGKAEEWQAARDAFAAALQENPTSERARAAMKAAERRLKPEIPGFKIVGSEFDSASGLPKEIVMDGLGIRMVLVSAGEFDMGSDKPPLALPVHTVSVAPFYMATHEMTQAQWKALMSANPSYYQGDKFPQADQMPVEHVSWDDCRAMLAEINKRVPGGGVRLPTEAEWEYAARAGSTDSSDAAKLLSTAWLRENSRLPGAAPDTVTLPDAGAAPGAKAARGPGPAQRARGGPDAGMAQLMGAMLRVEAAKLAAPDRYAPHPIGASQPNRWGLCDMLGNVSEWCSSLALPYPFDINDGRESATAEGPRVLRGGNFLDSIEAASVTLRHSDRPWRKLRWNGVRLAFTPPGEAPVPSGPKTRVSR